MTEERDEQQHKVEKMGTAILCPSKYVSLPWRQRLNVLLACTSWIVAAWSCWFPKPFDSWCQMQFSELGKNFDDYTEVSELLKMRSNNLWLKMLVSSQGKPSKTDFFFILFCSVLHWYKGISEKAEKCANSWILSFLSTLSHY